MTKTKIKRSELVDKLKRMEEINNKERIFLIKILGRYLMSNCKVTDRPSKEEKLQLCQALITAFPILRDNATSSGFEHFYDAKAHTGFLEMFIRQRRSRSDNIETLWSHSRKRDDVLLNSSEKVEQTLRELQPTTSNKESLLKMMADTRVVRRAWIQETSNLSITSIIRRFPRFIDMNDAIIQEFHSIEEASSNITLHDSFNTCKQNILLLARDLTMTNMFKYTLSEDEYNEEDTTLLAFKALPFLLKAPPQKGKKHPRMDPDAILALFYREMDVHFSLESSLELLKKEKVFQPILFKCCGSLFIKVDNTAIRLEAIPSTSFAFELLLASYYVFNVNFPHELICVYGFLGSLLGISSKGIIVNSFLKKVLPKV
ncbi:uncharacterized protein LOC136078293 [Hydra vulgaris]|uniref:Uncharacterized protein LOC136078293 n=1 Tax=Hydra vulgaris TaxID=6087 RepID=A0ABM4BLA6_HYDVU